jgi:hypothetical protein
MSKDERLNSTSNNGDSDSHYPTNRINNNNILTNKTKIIRKTQYYKVRF